MVKFEEREVVIQENISCRGMRLNVDAYGQIVVEVWYRFMYKDEAIQIFVDKNKRFIKSRLKRYAKTYMNLPDFNNGGKVCLLDKEYTVVRNDTIREFAIVGDKLNVPEKFGWYQTKNFFGGILFPHVQALTKYYSEKYAIDCSKVDLHTWRSAWATHFHDNTIKYNIALVFVPLSCIEYIVVHELCHTLQDNHSPAFWAEVEKIYPNYKEENARLNAYNLNWIFERAKLAMRG